METKIIDCLEQMGFNEKQNKKNCWVKEIGDDQFMYWDFNKLSKGRFYVTKSGNFESDLDTKTRDEYKKLRALQDGNGKEPLDAEVVTPSNGNGGDIVLRGNENEICNVVRSRRLDVIAKVAKDHIGEGILYHNLGKSIGMEPSAELIDMITADMGSITTEILEHGLRIHRDIEDGGKEYQTCYAIVRAVDSKKGTTGLGSCEEIFDYDELEKNQRTFALTKAIRKAERNAKERLIPVPRKALVELVKSLIEDNKKSK